MPVRTGATVTRHALCDEPACPRPPSTHDFGVLAYFVGGFSRVQHAPERELTLTAGDVLLLPPGMPHRTLEARRPEFWGLSLPFASREPHRDAALLEPFERVRDGASAATRIPADRHDYLDRLFRELEKAAHEGAPRSVQESLLTLILNEVVQAGGTDVPAGSPRRGLVVDALRHIERHALEPLTLQDVAAVVGRSPAHVTNVLKRETGRTAGAWIVSVRMAEARRLLLHSDERIDVIAERVGYADTTHFIRMFRRAHGVTPAAWRARSVGG